MRHLTTRTRWILLLLLLWAWAWRLWGLDAQSLWRDEMDSIVFATAPLAKVMGNFTRPGENGPLFFFSLRPWLALVGTSEFGLRFPSAMAGLIGLPLIFVWGKRLFITPVGLLAMLLLAVNPFHLWYSQDAKMYALLPALVMAALWAFASAMEGGGWRRWLVWFALTSICFYIHVFAVLVIPLQIIWLILVPAWRRRWRAFAIALILLIAPYLPLVWWQWALLVDPDFHTGHPFVALPQLLGRMFVSQVKGIPAYASTWFLVPVIFLILVALILVRRWRHQRFLVISWWLLPPLMLFVITLFTPLFTDRYLIWTLPALVLILALGLYGLGNRSRLATILLTLYLLGFGVFQGWLSMTQPIKSDFRAAASYINQRLVGDEVTLFLIPYIRPTYQYYAGSDVPWLDAPYANREPDASRIPSWMQQATDPYRSLWLVESEAEFYDRDGLIQRWLDEHGQLIDEAHFARVSVYRYRLP